MTIVFTPPSIGTHFVTITSVAEFRGTIKLLNEMARRYKRNDGI